MEFAWAGVLSLFACRLTAGRLGKLAFLVFELVEVLLLGLSSYDAYMHHRDQCLEQVPQCWFRRRPRC
jgi:hypothetical protein